jgi:DNA-binding MltR family transcriptional regulator
MKDDNNPFEASNRLNEITRDLDERGLVLTLAAFAEEALGELLGQFMLPGDAANALLKGFNAPLGTFSARIKAAFALGLLTSRQQGNLERLRQIRNEFAHRWEPITFDNQAVASHIAALHFTPLVSDFPETKISKVRDCISSVLVEIGSTTNQIRQKGKTVQVIGNHLIPGIIEDEADRVAACDQRLAEIERDLPAAKGERQKYLAAQRERWLALLTIYNDGASSTEKVAIAEVLQKHGGLSLRLKRLQS